MLRGVPVGQFLHLRRICTTWESFNNQAMFLWDRFIQRGYDFFKNAYDTAVGTSRNFFMECDTSRPTHWLDIKGCYRCGGNVVAHALHVVATLWRYMRPSKDFKGNNNSRRYKIHFYPNCGTSNIVYLITCNCGLQYVGKTIRSFRKRLSEHLNCVSLNDLNSAIAKHLMECHAIKLCVHAQIIDRVVMDTRK
ncbi:hypothetical protein XELAEV_18046462mg [Xenopus laevis]|uniref:GIY-YIG domain-containing protein n=1 Tax=Xenopus laevis TaxID=8355 RepID=A0A974H0L1_XENLA|nr:hypothetical protein XELAEV_18046462mg [Xenopus laevis]